MLEAAAQPFAAGVRPGVSGKVVVAEGARIGHGGERGGEELQFVAIEEHFRNVTGHEEAEVPHAALGNVHRLLQAEAGQQGVDQDQVGDVLGVGGGPGEGNHGADVVAGNSHGAGEVQRGEDAADVVGLVGLGVAALRPVAVAGAAQVGNDDGVVSGEVGHDAGPGA